MAGHAHNPDTQENSGYFFFSMLPLGIIPKKLTIPELPYGFTAVKFTKLTSVHYYEEPCFAAILTGVSKDGKLLLFRVH